MRKIHCNGCGMSEDLNAPRHTIETVTLSSKDDQREWVANKVYEADLCGECLSRVLHNYFDISAEGRLEIPAFIQPLKAVETTRGAA